VIREGLTQRIFDCLACGSFIITDRKAIVPEFFSTHGPFAEVIMFDDDKHAKELILYYAKNDTERDAIVERGRNRVLSEHTYDHRIGTIFKVLSGELGTRAI
jgi:spore maturation protein CgeB